METKKDIKIIELIAFIVNCIFILISGNSYYLIKSNKIGIIAVLIMVFLGNILPFYTKKSNITLSLRVLSHGLKCLSVFLITTSISILFQLLYIGKIFPIFKRDWLLSVGVLFIVQAIIFWNGIISVYITSIQLGIKLRIIGVIFGMVPIINLIVLIRILIVVKKELDFELKRLEINYSRKELMICKTRYPILLVHGVFFRDYKLLNYWGRIPKELEKNGATIFYGKHESATTVKKCGEELARRIKSIVYQTGCEKINIIAHSKGGLDCRYAISNPEVAKYVATLTTINTPHRGCMFADYLLEKAPVSLKESIGRTYNSILVKIGDKEPDFLSAVGDLTSKSCKEFNENNKIPKGIRVNSVGSKLNYASSGRFPLNYSYLFVKLFDKENDGLVGKDSFEFGDSFTYITVKGKRGVSHGDMIDLNRENIDEFDVREFYVELVSRLREEGY